MLKEMPINKNKSKVEPYYELDKPIYLNIDSPLSMLPVVVLNKKKPS